MKYIFPIAILLPVALYCGEVRRVKTGAASLSSRIGVACRGVMMPAQANYDPRIVQGAVRDFMPLIAITAESGAFRVEGPRVRADLDRNGKSESFRSCASLEGLHLTVWEGKPLEGARLWHAYYYLGMDIEANCTDKDTAGGR